MFKSLLIASCLFAFFESRYIYSNMRFKDDMTMPDVSDINATKIGSTLKF